MWVKRTEKEIAEEQRRQRNRHFRYAALVWTFVTVILTCVFSSKERRGQFVVPRDEILSRIPLVAVLGFVTAFGYYKCEKWEKRKRPMMICPQCEATKYMDDTTKCSCGSCFEKMDDMKYVA